MQAIHASCVSFRGGKLFASALCQSRGTMTAVFLGTRRRSGELPLWSASAFSDRMGSAGLGRIARAQRPSKELI
jgi:hypothetical protein